MQGNTKKPLNYNNCSVNCIDLKRIDMFVERLKITRILCLKHIKIITTDAEPAKLRTRRYLLVFFLLK